MKIGILTYHAACNYGANLQVLSTIGYIKRNGHTPIVIDYQPIEMMEIYHKTTPAETFDAFRIFRNEYMPLSSICKTSKDISEVITKEEIEAVIIGSDAVLQHHTLFSRMIFPSKRIISVSHYSNDRLYPNPFWGEFMGYISKKIPVVLMSASSQNSQYKYYLPLLKKRMYKSLSEMDYISVRDKWTQNMIMHISNGIISPDITPDPVFAFNSNCEHYIPTKEDIVQKYNLPQDYVLVSFWNDTIVSHEWVLNIEKELAVHGLSAVALPFPQGMLFTNKLKYQIPSPLLPLDWYALIKYSKGYIGNNMHPIIVSLHNRTPFFSFDNWGTKGLWKFEETSSKIYHILSEADLLENRIRATTSNVKITPKLVVDRIISFDVEKSNKIAIRKYNEYEKMMKSIISLFNVK